MAKANTKKPNKKKQANTKRTNTLANRKRNEIKIEITFLLVIACVLILFLGNIGTNAFLIKKLAYFFFGLFGMLEYVFPIVVFLTAWIIMANLGNNKLTSRVIILSLIFWFLCGIFQLGNGYVKSYGYGYYFLHGANTRTGGGFMGGLLVKTLASLLGTVGTGIILVIGLLVLLCIFSGKTMLLRLVDSIKNGSGKIGDTLKSEKKRREEMLLQNQNDYVSPKSLDDDLDDDIKTKSLLDKSKKKKELTRNTITFTTPFTVNEKQTDDFDDISILDKETEELIDKQDEKVSREDTKNETKALVSKIQNDNKTYSNYILPPLSLLKKGKAIAKNDSDVKDKGMKLNQILQSFGVKARVIGYRKGPSVTQFEVQPDIGVKVKKISDLTDDIKLGLAVSDIRIEAPIPGKSVVGIEIPNDNSIGVMLRDLLESTEFKNAKSKISFAVGRDIAGKVVVSDIAKLPHLLIGGSTGSGKSVFMNTLIMSILYKASPDEVKFFMIDPKMIELSIYNKIPHLFVPVVTDPKKAAGVLNYAVVEMTKRYKLFSELGVKNLEEYNAKLLKNKKGKEENSYIVEGEEYKKKPQIVIVVDEFADLMMVAKGEVEESVCRLAQLARAAGIHLILATQRPSVDVITGLIKANMPSRCALLVSSGVDSRTIIDQGGAEKLLGNGDMLYSPSGTNHPIRIQGGYVSGSEVESVVKSIVSQNGKLEVDETVEQEINMAINSGSAVGGEVTIDKSDTVDEYLKPAAYLIIEKQKASVGMLQRQYRIGFNRAARIMDSLHELGVVSEEEGTKPRKVLLNSTNDFEERIKEI